MSVCQAQATISSAEFIEWLAFFALESEMITEYTSPAPSSSSPGPDMVRDPEAMVSILRMIASTQTGAPAHG